MPHIQFLKCSNTEKKKKGKHDSEVTNETIPETEFEDRCNTLREVEVIEY